MGKFAALRFALSFYPRVVGFFFQSKNVSGTGRKATLCKDLRSACCVLNVLFHELTQEV